MSSPTALPFTNNLYAPSAVAYIRAEEMGFAASKLRRKDFTAPVGQGSPRSELSKFEVGGTYRIASFQVVSLNSGVCQSPPEFSVARQPVVPLLNNSTDPSKSSTYSTSLIGVWLMEAVPRRRVVS